jgi:eukaryotic-like serine/threonine-protein kinase
VTSAVHTTLDFELEIGPPDTGPDAAAMRARLAEQLFGEAPREVCIGRFEVIELLGAGGMGVVYLARDPRLDRRVAIKVLQKDIVAERGRDRMEREALALARLSHPNVTQVYEVGEHEGTVFLAMEYVEGVSLREWQAQTSRRWPQLLDVHLAAGEGLAAAHAAGIVHRDYKPANVLVGVDGRVRVADFGLASGSGLMSEEVRPSDSPLHGPLSELTSPGTKLGTPAYMSPEQLRGEDVDARSDQFSWCVALWEALFGQRPYELDELRVRGVREHSVAPAGRSHAKGGRHVPRWLRRVLARGLALGPEERWPSMEVLLTKLRSASKRQPRRRMMMVAGVALAATWVVAQPASEPDVCAAADVERPWDEALRDRVIAAAEAHGHAYAREAAAQVVASLEQHARRWEQVRRASCEGAFTRRTHSAEQYDLSMRCLERLRRQARGTANVLADEAAFARADVLITELEPPERCIDAVELRRVAAPRPEDADGVAEIRGDLEHAKVARMAGAYIEASTVAQDAVRRARQIEYTPVLAEALLAEGSAHAALAHYDSAHERLMEAVNLAEASRHDEVASDAWRRLIEAAVQREDFSHAREWAERSQAALERIDAPAIRLAEHLDAIGRLALATEQAALAVTLHEAAAEARRSVLSDDDPRVAATAINLANALAASGRLDAAIALYRETLARRLPRIGPSHPEIAVLRFDLGYAELQRGDTGEAQREFAAALEIQRAVFGNASSDVGRTLAALALTASTAGKHDEAVQRGLASWEIQKDALDRGHTERTAGLAVAVNALFETRAYEDVLPLLHALLDDLGDADPVARASLEYNLGEALCKLKRCEEALPHYQWVIDHADDVDHVDDPLLRLLALVGLGHVALETGDREQGLRHLQEAERALAELPDTDPQTRANLMWSLAEGLAAAGAPKSRWHPHLQAARRAFADRVADLDDRHEAQDAIDAIDAWLASR